MPMFLCEFDLAGAEWVVTAYLARDKNMIGVIESGKSPHIVTGALISGAPEEFVEKENKVVGSNTDPTTIASLRREMDIPKGIFMPRSMSIRQAGKKSNHGLNYGMKYRRFALENELPETDAEPIVELYSTVAYPGLQDYWRETREEMRAGNRVLENCFGRRVKLLDEWGPELWMAAYSFKPQSTVVDVCLEAMCEIYEDESIEMLMYDLGAQVHDSLMGQLPVPVTDEECDKIGQIILKKKRYMTKELEYHGRKFTLGTDLKIGLNWGQMSSIITKDRTAFQIGDDIRTSCALSSAPPPPADPESPALEVPLASEVSEAVEVEDQLVVSEFE